MFSETSTLLAPFVLCEKRRRFAGWTLRPERCFSSTRFRRDPWLCWTSSRCEVPSICLLLPSPSPLSCRLSAMLAGLSCLSGNPSKSGWIPNAAQRKNSDPAVLDKRLNASPILSLKFAERKRRGGPGRVEGDGDRFDRRFRWPVSLPITRSSRLACLHSVSITDRGKVRYTETQRVKLGQRNLWNQLGSDWPCKKKKKKKENWRNSPTHSAPPLHQLVVSALWFLFFLWKNCDITCL